MSSELIEDPLVYDLGLVAVSLVEEVEAVDGTMAKIRSTVILLQDNN